MRRGLRLAAGGVCPPGLQREAPQVLQETVEPNVEQVVEGPEVHILQEQEVIAHVPVVIQQKQQVQRIVEVLVPMTRGEIVHVPKIVQQVRQHYIPVEEIDDVHVPQVQEGAVQVPEIHPQERIGQRTVEEVVEAPVPVAQEEVAYITYAECQRIGQMLAKHLASKEEAGEEVREEDLIAWYVEQVEEEIQTEAQLFEQQHLVQFVINRLVDKDRVIVVYRPAEDPMRPEGRVLVKHPNFPVGEIISGAHAEDEQEQELEEELELLPVALAELDPLYGAEFVRVIDEVEFGGIVVGISMGVETGERLYRVAYHDGEGEDLTAEELRDLLRGP